MNYAIILEKGSITSTICLVLFKVEADNHFIFFVTLIGLIFSKLIGMAFYSKLKWILGIAMVFVLIITTNLIDKNNFVRVRDSVVTIYEDRLIANDIIVEMLLLVQQKELALHASTLAYGKKGGSDNDAFSDLISRYEATKLTSEERKFFEALKQNLTVVSEVEKQVAAEALSENTQMINAIHEVKNSLRELSKIQLVEGSKQMSISKRALDTVELFTNIEIYLLVVLALAIQVIVMYNPTKK